ncbi:MAG: DinB family protein [Gemmatimonadaceae bacterium]
MKSARTMLLSAMIALTLPMLLAAQESGPASGTALRRELLAHFNMSMQKFIVLAEAMPAESYSWRPEKDAMQVARVYAHVANYNYHYLASSMGVAAPADINLDTLEAIQDKAQIVQLLRRSADHVRRAVADMPASQLEKNTKLYGREVPQWAVLMQLVAHMNEHLGQSIAYARSNNVVPPWSR